MFKCLKCSETLPRSNRCCDIKYFFEKPKFYQNRLYVLTFNQNIYNCEYFLSNEKLYINLKFERIAVIPNITLNKLKIILNNNQTLEKILLFI